MIAKIHRQLHEFFGMRDIFHTLYSADANIQRLKRGNCGDRFDGCASKVSHGSPLVRHRVGGRRNRRIAALIADRHAWCEGKWNHAGPHRQCVIRRVALRGADTPDYALPVWAGVIPLSLTPGVPIRDERCDSAIPTPAYAMPYKR